MSDTLEPLVLDLIEWVAKEPRTYAEVMLAWRTSWAPLTIWEDAIDRKLIKREARPEGGAIVVVSVAGARLLEASRAAKGQLTRKGWPAGAS